MWAILLAALPCVAVGQPDCTFDQAAVAAQLAAKAHKVWGAHRVSPTEYRWQEPSGHKVSIGFGGCVDLGAEVSVSRAAGPSEELTANDLIRAVARYWSAADARAFAAALSTQLQRSHLAHEPEQLDFGPGASDAFPSGFTVSLSANRVAVSWQEL